MRRSRAAPGCCARSTTRACSPPPTFMWRGDSPRCAASPTTTVALAAALAVRGPRWATCSSTWRPSATRRRSTRTTRSTSPRCPGRTRMTGASAWPAAASRGSGRGRRRAPLRLDGSRLYLDRYLGEERQIADDLIALAGCARRVDDVLGDGLGRLFGDADAPSGLRPPPMHPSWCSVRRHDRSPATHGRGCSRRRRRQPAARRGGRGPARASRSSPAVPAPARPPPWRGSWRCLPSRPRRTGRRRRSSRSPRRPARPPRGSQEAVHDEAATLDVAAPVRALLDGLPASTLHRLLGWRFDSETRFRHDRANRLAHDVVVVDETSMVSLSLMARLVEAVRRDARLVLLGDPGQLTSVEAGAVLGDVVGPAADALADATRGSARLMRATGEALPADAPDAAVIGDGIVVLDRVHGTGAGSPRWRRPSAAAMPTRRSPSWPRRRRTSPGCRSTPPTPTMSPRPRSPARSARRRGRPWPGRHEAVPLPAP